MVQNLKAFKTGSTSSQNTLDKELSTDSVTPKRLSLPWIQPKSLLSMKTVNKDNALSKFKSNALSSYSRGRGSKPLSPLASTPFHSRKFMGVRQTYKAGNRLF